MAVTLPSDIIADVMRNADPARRQAAISKLQTLATPEQAFAGLMDQVGASTPANQEPVGTITAFSTRRTSAVTDTDADGKMSALRDFEHMVLRNLFESILPSEESGAFGGGPSAGIWRTMAADQFAGVYADQGGIGIASMLSAAATSTEPQRAGEWPYFRVASIRGFAG